MIGTSTQTIISNHTSTFALSGVSSQASGNGMVSTSYYAHNERVNYTSNKLLQSPGLEARFACGADTHMPTRGKGW